MVTYAPIAPGVGTIAQDDDPRAHKCINSHTVTHTHTRTHQSTKSTPRTLAKRIFPAILSHYSRTKFRTLSQH